jgi:hypothetical protein
MIDLGFLNPSPEAMWAWAAQSGASFVVLVFVLGLVAWINYREGQADDHWPEG